MGHVGTDAKGILEFFRKKEGSLTKEPDPRNPNALAAMKRASLSTWYAMHTLNRTDGAMMKQTAAALVLSFILLATTVFAGHNGAVVSSEGGACEPTTISAQIADPAGTHKVANMRLVVDDGTNTVFDFIPINGDTVEVEVGPFASDTTVLWRVFGGGERAYDQPLWNGYGGATFTADINAYGAANGFGFVVAGSDDPNPFTTWNELKVAGCSPNTVKDCKLGGWEDYGFSNQGQCIRFLNTGQDSR